MRILHTLILKLGLISNAFFFIVVGASIFLIKGEIVSTALLIISSLILFYINSLFKLITFHETGMEYRNFFNSKKVKYQDIEGVGYIFLYTYLLSCQFPLIEAITNLSNSLCPKYLRLSL